MSGTTKPLVSVIIAAYNAAAFIKEAIDSVLNQTYSNLEIVIVEDGSTDDTLKILKNYTDKRIQLLLNDQNRGLVYSLNRALKQAKGEYIARFDADDICKPNRIEVQLSFYRSHHVDILGAAMERFGILKGIAKFPLTDAEIKVQLLFSNPLVHPTVFFHRKLIDEGLYWYDEKWKHVEDYELWVRLMDTCNFANIPEALISYRTSGGSVCNTYGHEQLGRNELLSHVVLHKLLPGYHCNLVEKKWLKNSNSIKTIADIRHIHDFILKLVNANNQKCYFKQHVFARVLSKQFLATCLVNNNPQQQALKLYLDLLKRLSVKKKIEPVLRLFSKGFVNRLR